MPGYAKHALVEPDWLEPRLDDDSLRILEIDEDPALYAAGHIPGAIGLDWRRDLQDPVRRRFLGPDELGALLGERGVSNDHLTVVYGDRNNWFAAFGYWYLRYYGHDNVRLLNGPRERWIADGRPTERALPAHAPTTFTAGEGNEAIRAQRDEVLRALGASSRSSTSARRASTRAGRRRRPARAARAPSARAISRGPGRCPGRTR